MNNFDLGELDYEELFYGEENNTGNILFAGIEMLALAIFVVFVTVLLLNFLIGLAADEIKVCLRSSTFLTLTDDLILIRVIFVRIFETEQRFGVFVHKLNKFLYWNHFWIKNAVKIS